MEKLKIYGKKDNEKRKFLGTIYINEKKELVIDIKDFQVKKDIFQEINKELQKYGGIRFVQRGERHIKTAEDLKKYRTELIQEFQKILGGDFEKYIEESKEILNILKKKNIKEEENKEFEKRREKISKKLEGYGLSWTDLVMIVWPEKKIEIRLNLKWETIEKLGSPLFLVALRGHLASSDKKYGSYVLVNYY